MMEESKFVSSVAGNEAMTNLAQRKGATNNHN
jgi:hypothetical protein